MNNLWFDSINKWFPVGGNRLDWRTGSDVGLIQSKESNESKESWESDFLGLAAVCVCLCPAARLCILDSTLQVNTSHKTKAAATTP